MRFSWIGLLDRIAHHLYCPCLGFHRVARARWCHRIHLIPGSWLRWCCDRCERKLGVTKEEMYRK